MGIDAVRPTMAGSMAAWRVKFEAIKPGLGGASLDIMAAVLITGGHLNEFNRSAEIVACMAARGGPIPLLEIRRLSEFMPVARSILPEDRSIDGFLANLHQLALKHQSIVYEITVHEEVWEGFKDAIISMLSVDNRRMIGVPHE